MLYGAHGQPLEPSRVPGWPSKVFEQRPEDIVNQSQSLNDYRRDRAFQEDLDQRERDLRAREQEINRREEELWIRRQQLAEEVQSKPPESTPST